MTAGTVTHHYHETSLTFVSHARRLLGRGRVTVFPANANTARSSLNLILISIIYQKASTTNKALSAPQSCTASYIIFNTIFRLSINVCHFSFPSKTIVIYLVTTENMTSKTLILCTQSPLINSNYILKYISPERDIK